MWATATEVYEVADKNGYKKGLLVEEIMRNRGKGIYAGSACMGGGISQALMNNNEELALELLQLYRECFDEFFIEIHTNTMPEQHELNIKLVNFARKNKAPMIYAVDSHYLTQDEADMQQAFMGIGMRKKITDEKTYNPTSDYYLMTEQEIRNSLAYLGQDVVDECFSGVEKFVNGLDLNIYIDRSRKVPKPFGVEDSDKTLVEK